MKKIFLLFLILNSQFLILNSQSIVSVKPNYVVAGDTATVTITGINTNFTKIDIGNNMFFNNFSSGNPGIGMNFTSYKVINDTSLIAKILPYNNVKMYWDLIYSEFNSLIIVKRNALYIDAPSGSYETFSTVSPDTGKAGQKLQVTITGSGTDFYNFFSMSGDADYFYFADYNGYPKGIVVDSFKVYTMDSMKTYLNISPNAIQGYNNLYEFNGADQFIYGKTNAFYVEAPNCPKIINITPNHALNNQTLNVTIKSKNTNFPKCNYTLNSYGNLSLAYEDNFFNGNNNIIVNSVNPINDTTMVLNITVSPGLSSGYRDLIIWDSISNYNNYGILNTFWVGPYLSSVSPGIVGLNQTVTIDMNTVNADFTDAKYVKAWLSNTNGYNADIDASKVAIKGPQLISATFTIPANATQGLWDVYIADDKDGVFYRVQLLQIMEGVSVKNNAFSNLQIFKLYPNPISDKVYIEYNLSKPSPVSLELFNIAGEKVFSIISGNKQSGNNSEIINVAQMNLKQGVYFIKFTSDNNTFVSKIVKL